MVEQNFHQAKAEEEEGLLGMLLITSRRRQWHPTPALLPGKSHGWRSLVGCSPRGREESDTTEQLPFPFPLCQGDVMAATGIQRREFTSCICNLLAL